MTCRQALMVLGLAVAAQGCAQRILHQRIDQDTTETIQGETIVVPDKAAPPPKPDKAEVETTIERRVIKRETVP